MKNIYLAISCVMVVLTSCFKDDYDFNNVNLDDYNPSVAAPLVNTRLTLHDLIETTISSDSSIISIDEDSLLWVTYSANLFQLGIDELFTISDQNISESFTMEAFELANINQNASVSLGDVVATFSEPEKSQIQSADGNNAPFPAISSRSGGEHSAGTFAGFSFVNFTSGTLTIDVTNNWPVDLNNLTIEIRNSDNSVIGTVSYPLITAGSTASDAIDLAGKTMQNSIKANITNIESPGAPFPQTVPIDLTDDISLNISTSNMNVSDGEAEFPSGEVLNDTVEVSMGLGNGEMINSIRLKAGKLVYDIDYGIREDAALSISLPYATLGGAAFNEVININSNNSTATTVRDSFDLAGYTLDLTAGGTDTNNVLAVIAANIVSSGSPVPFSQADGVDADLTLRGLEIEFIDGDLGQQSFNLAADTLDFGFDELEFEADIALADPRLTLKIANSFGMELRGYLDTIQAENDTESKLLTGIDSINIGAPTYGNFGDSVITNIEINRVTTNIDEVLGINPNKLIFGMTGATNPGSGPFNNFVTDDSYIGVSMDLEVPLYGSVSGFQLRDTLDFPVEAFENVLTAKLKTRITNEFPVDVDVQVYFVDESFTILDSLASAPIEILQSSSIDSDGELVEATEFVTDIDLTEDRVNALKNATQMILVSNMSTANGQSAKFYTSYGMDIRVGVFAKVKIELKDEN